MNLTFEGFLKSYCKELSGLGTLSLRKLCDAASNQTPRVAEPLVLYAASQGKLPYMSKLCEGTWIEELCQNALHAFPDGLPHSDDALAKSFAQPDIAERFRKVWTAYLAQKKRIQSEHRVAGLMRKKTLAALEGANTTCYRLCENLGLNKGNVYAYLHAGDLSKVSLATARRIMNYALTL